MAEQVVPGEVRAVVGRHGMDGARHGLDEGSEEVSGAAPRGLLVQLDKGEFGDPVAGNQQIEPSLCSLHLGDVDVDAAERIGLELAFARRALSASGNREMLWRCRQRCSDDRVRCGRVA